MRGFVVHKDGEWENPESGACWGQSCGAERRRWPWQLGVGVREDFLVGLHWKEAVGFSLRGKEGLAFRAAN